jgi:hypothetical protein
VRAERRTDDEAREALLGVLVRVLDEFRFGLREVTTDDLVELARVWAMLNAGETPAEVALRLANPSRHTC